ncbi:hypothetical protein [Paraburkholderia antibiotica]|uniref:Uncharacterized protein n=1 Tax=Paraburkholderia antibiotica TaxID=2728839 RepID=A0A7Y0A2V2_9BURK|nr:hypothetical protein [Paraburkholderia antibiotica]NML35535.1 hypothetical protein [Paraburkholderia antibiotica]
MSTIFDAAIIQIRVERAALLFESFDHSPFKIRALNQAVEAYIVSHTENLSARRSIHLVFCLPVQEATQQQSSDMEQAVNHHFSERADATQQSLSALFRIGRRSLAIGLAVLAASLVAVKFADNLPGARFPKLFAEGLTIFGWVANWRPMEIFLYDWWPIAGQRNIYRRLASATVSVKVDD